MQIVRRIARPLLASSFIVSGVDRVRHADSTAENLGPVLRPLAQSVPNLDEKRVARILGGTQIAAAALLALGKLPRLAGFLLTVTSGINAAAEFRNADTSSAESRSHRRSQLLKNASLTGGVLLASVDTAGKPGLAWRAGHLAQTTGKASRKQLKRAAKDVKKNAKHARHSVAGTLGAE